MKRKIVFLIFLAILLIQPGTASDMELDTGRHPWTPMADISNTINNSERYDYHVTYFDPDQALAEYEESKKYAHENQILSPGPDGSRVVEYALDMELAGKVDDIKSLLESGDTEKARQVIKEVRRRDPRYWKADTYSGRSYMLEGDYKTALEYFEKALKKNPIDFDAHRWAGQCRMKMEDYHGARQDFIRCIISNRNDPGAWESLRELGELAGFTLFDRPFIPLYRVELMDNGKHRIYLDKDTLPRQMPYGFCKAYWRHEPGYFQKRIGEEEYRLTFIEEMECLRNLLWSYNAFKIRGQMEEDPYLERLANIKNRFYLKQFVYFDVLSPKHPEILASMDEKYIPDMIDYFNEFFILEKNPDGKVIKNNS